MVDWGSFPGILAGDRRDRRREQARLTTVWLTPSDGQTGITLYLYNGSLLPVRDVMVATSEDLSKGLANVYRITALPPQQTYVAASRFQDPFDVSRIVIEFTDARGRRWQKDPRGKLRIIRKRTRNILSSDDWDYLPYPMTGWFLLARRNQPPEAGPSDGATVDPVPPDADPPV